MVNILASTEIRGNISNLFCFIFLKEGRDIDLGRDPRDRMKGLASKQAITD